MVGWPHCFESVAQHGWKAEEEEFGVHHPLQGPNCQQVKTPG
jgi:hypothetical protein